MFKILISILLAFLTSFLINIFNQPKHNDIPVQPYSLKVSLKQELNDSLTLQSVSVADTYPSDYQAGIDSNYYTLYLKNGEEILFTGQIPKKNIIIIHDYDEQNPETEPDSEIITASLDNFELYLPYYEQAKELIVVDDQGRRALSVDLAEYNLQLPQEKAMSCGDGICSDGENIVSCRKDCPFRLR